MPSGSIHSLESQLCEVRRRAPEACDVHELAQELRFRLAMAARDERAVYADERLPAPVRAQDVRRAKEALEARDERHARVRERCGWRCGGGGDGGVSRPMRGEREMRSFLSTSASLPRPGGH